MTMLLLGAVVAELGLVALAPWLVGVASRAASRLPTTPRLALRDAGRNRLRAGTAVAAVLSAVAGAAAMGIWVASDNANAERHHVPIVPEGYVAVAVERGAWPGGDVSAVESALPTETAVAMSSMGRSSCLYERCAEWKVEQQVDPCVVSAGNDGVCGYSFGSPWGPWIFGDGTTYRALTGVDPGSGITTALKEGGVVVGTDYAGSYVADGQMTFESRRTGERVLLPAAIAPSTDVGPEPRFELLLSQQARETLGLRARDLGYTVITTRAPTGAELAAARSAVADITLLGTVTAGTGFVANTAVPILIILGIALLLAVAATATATGLAAADARPDLATLAAVGASPRTRRWVSASQAAVISVLGTGLGVLGGLVIGVAAIGATTDHYFGYSSDGPAPPTLPLSVPWGTLGVLAVVVPTVAVTLAFLFSRSSLPMVRRIE
jgi:putative ABC transport system permease protein